MDSRWGIITMQKILIGIPTIDKVDASFMSSVLGMDYSDGNKYSFTMRCNSLIYDARGSMTIEAINGGYDYLLMLDSDMVMERDTVRRLAEGVHDKDLLTALYFKRKLPTKPLILKELDWYEDEVLGAQESAEVYEKYPRNSVFEIQGAGFGCCIMSVEMVKHMTVAYRMNPFTPMPRLSEDYSFCWRARKLGYKLWCDSRIRPLHAGLKLYGEADWDRQREVRE
jgi:hypothetical protein